MRSLARAYCSLLECSTFSRNGGVQFIQPPRKTLTVLTSVHECDSSTEKVTLLEHEKTNTLICQVRTGEKKKIRNCTLQMITICGFWKALLNKGFSKHCIWNIPLLKRGYTQKRLRMRGEWKSGFFMLMFGVCFLPPSSFTFRMAFGNGTALMLKPDRKKKKGLH